MRKVITTEITAVIEGGRIIQLFSYGETNNEHCVHGIKLRWHCDDCENDVAYEEAQ